MLCSNQDHMVIVMRNIVIVIIKFTIIMIGVEISDLLSRYCLVDNILYLATKVRVHIIDTYLCICLVIDNIQPVANVSL